MTQRQIDQYVAPQEAARLLGVTTIRVTQLAQAGKLPHLTTPLGRLFPRAEIELFARDRKQRAAEKATAA